MHMFVCILVNIIWLIIVISIEYSNILILILDVLKSDITPEMLFSGIHGNPTRSGRLKSLDKFDAPFFGLSPGVTDTTDPGLRKMLEVCYEAIVDSGK